MEYDVYCNFDLEKHNETYLNYLEVVVSDEGDVEYAVPSHQEILIKKYMEKYGLKSREDVNISIPSEFWLDVIDWLCYKTGYVSVWWEGYIKGIPNDKQMKVLNELIDSGAMQPLQHNIINVNKRNLELLLSRIDS